MDGTDDGRFEPVRIFLQSSFRLEPDTWREAMSEKSQLTAAVSRFINGPEILHLFLYLQPDSGLWASLSPPPGLHTKVLCVSRTAREALTKDNCDRILRMQECRGGEGLRILLGVSQEVTCELLSRAESNTWGVGMVNDALKLLERQKSSAQVMEAKVEGHTLLPPPALCHQDDLACLHPGGGYRDDRNCTHQLLQEPSPDTLHDNNDSDTSNHDIASIHCRNLHDYGCHVDRNQQKPSVDHLLPTCEETVVEWVELVSDFLQQDWYGPVLDWPKAIPSEEETFWKKRLENLLFIQNQLMSPRAQQVASILQSADSIYWTTLQDLQSRVQEGVWESKDILVNLTPVLQKLSEVLEMDFHQLRDNMVAVMEEVRLLWIRSQFYCRPRRIVVLLQEICTLLIQLSRKFLPGQEIIGVLVSEPGPVLEEIRLVIQTLQALKSAYAQKQIQLELQNQNQASPTASWTFPSHLVFSHLDAFLRRLLSIQEVHGIAARFYQLDRAVLSGVDGPLLTDGVQRVYQDFLVQVRLLSGCICDPTDPEDQAFDRNLHRYQAQVSDLETRLVAVLNQALEDCSEASSVAKLVQMFWFFLDRSVVQDRLAPYQNRLVEQVLIDLDQTELEFFDEREKPERFFRFCPAGAARLCWARQLRRRAQETLRSFRSIQIMCGWSDFSHLVLQRSRRVVDLLQDFRASVRSDWSSRLELDCGWILDHPLIQMGPQDCLEVGCRYQVEEVLQELRYMNREGDVKLRPHTTHFLAARDDITQTYLSLSHMVSCYNQVVGGAMEVELPLIQEQLHELKQTLDDLQKKSWISEGVQQQSQQVLILHLNIREARANMATMRHITQGWAELDLLQRSEDSLLEGGVKDETCRAVKADGEQVLRLIQVNQSLYKTKESTQTWNDYLDFIDDKVQDGLLQLLLRALHLLTDSMNPQSCGPALLAVSLQVQQTDLVFEPTLDDGVVDFLKTIIRDIYGAAGLVPRFSVSRHGNYQMCLKQNPELCSLEQEVMTRLLQGKEEAEHLREGLDRYSHLWLGDKRAMFQEFLTYGKQLAAGEKDAERKPPTLKDFQREIQVLLAVSSDLNRLEEVVLLQGWLQVDLRPFTTWLMSSILEWKHMYTNYLLDSASKSLQQATRPGDDEEESSWSSSTLTLTDTVLLLEAAGVELPEHLAAQLQ